MEKESETHKAQMFLATTDWMVMRHRDQLELNIDTSLDHSEYEQLLVDRQNARDSMIKGEYV